MKKLLVVIAAGLIVFTQTLPANAQTKSATATPQATALAKKWGADLKTDGTNLVLTFQGEFPVTNDPNENEDLDDKVSMLGKRILRSNLKGQALTFQEGSAKAEGETLVITKPTSNEVWKMHKGGNAGHIYKNGKKTGTVFGYFLKQAQEAN